MDSSALQSERVEVTDDLWAANAFFEEKGWKDRLPIIPPTEERVGQMIAAVKRSPGRDRCCAASLGAGHCRKNRYQRRHGGLLAAIYARPDRGGGGLNRSQAESLRASSDHGWTGDHVDRQWSNSKTAQHQWRFKCSRRRLACQRHHRPLHSLDSAGTSAVPIPEPPARRH